MRRLILSAVVMLGLTGAVVYILTRSDVDGEPGPLDESLLRLSDLPYGYTLGNDGGCGEMTPEGRPPALDAILGMTFPTGCSIEFRRPPADEGPFAVQSGAIDFPTTDLASRVLTVAPELGRATVGTNVNLKAEPYDFEDEAVTLAFQDVNTREDGVLLIWRSGSRINLISVVGEAQPMLLATTRDLAEIQQRRSEKPEPLTDKDNDSRAVMLDRSDLGVPVYWIGLDFTPPGQPAMKLREGIGPLSFGGSPGNRVKIDYESTQPPRRAAAGIELAIWRRADWDIFVMTTLGDLSTEPPCGEPEVIQLTDRRIEIHARSPNETQPVLPVDPPPPATPPSIPPALGFPLDTVEDQCPRNHVGVVTFADAVVVINGVNCFACGGPGGLYDSREGIESVARALTRR